jgi:hypothetical protein
VATIPTEDLKECNMYTKKSEFMAKNIFIEIKKNYPSQA